MVKIGWFLELIAGNTIRKYADSMKIMSYDKVLEQDNEIATLRERVGYLEKIRDKMESLIADNLNLKDKLKEATQLLDEYENINSTGTV